MVSLADPRPRAGRLMALPEPVGPLTEALFATLRCDPGEGMAPVAAHAADPIADLDLQLALYCCYELHYASFAGVAEDWEWEPSLLAFRAGLERPFEAAVEALVPPLREDVGPEGVGDALQRIVAAAEGPPLSRWLETRGGREQMLEHVVHRSAYQLKEADPHSWAIPRLTPTPKAALLEVQFDEYGGERPERMHALLFARTMAALGLDDAYGAFLEWLPGVTLATVNLVTGFGLKRSRRGALVGHLAAFEMTSSIPNRRYGNALRRLGYGKDATDFYDEHVEADAVHEAIAAWDLAGGLAREEPALVEDVLFGARALLAVEGRWGEHLLRCWERGETSLRRPLAAG